MAMSSLQYGIIASLLARNIRRENDGPLIGVKISEVHLPGVVLQTEPKITTTFGDMMYPWIGRWMGSVRVRGEYVDFEMFSYKGDRRLSDTFQNTQSLPYGWLVYWQIHALARQLEALRLSVKETGPNKVAVQGLMFIVHQVKDAIRGLNGEGKARARDGSDPFIRIMATTAWRPAFLDISSIPNLRTSEAIGTKRSQTLYTYLAVHLDPPRLIEVVNWKIQLQLRAPVLMHELRDHETADEFLLDAVKADFRDRDPDADKMSDSDVELALRTAVAGSGVSLSVLARGYVRRGLKPSDFPLLCMTWANYVRRNTTLEPRVPGTADAARAGNSVWCYQHPSWRC